MKKFTYVLSALALASMALVSCNKEGKGEDYSDVEDGFYVAGAATGIEGLDSKLMMTAGINEVDKTKRDGMYEKYVVLEEGKDFELLLFTAGEKVRYSANLSEVTLTEEQLLTEAYGENPSSAFFKGSLITGDSAPAMKVSKTALYHIVLDLDKAGDLAKAGGAQIVISPCEWGVRGGMNGWGFTAMTTSDKLSNTSAVTYKIENAELGKGGEFKFAHAHAWKITLDEAGKVKAEVSLGGSADKLEVGAGNLSVADAGKYTITFTYNLSSGVLGNSFKANVECTEVSTIPTEMYIIGNEFGNWDWASDGVVSMVPVHSHEGMFWAVRYMTTTTEFKFCAKREWNGDFCTLKENEGFITPGNDQVEKDGLYTIIVDLKGDKVSVIPAEIFGIGDAFGAWNEGSYAFEAGQTATITTAAAGNLRMYVAIPGNTGNWWQSEFNIYDGKIVYRANGGDQDAVPVAAGAIVTLDFNAGTGSIK